MRDRAGSAKVYKLLAHADETDGGFWGEVHGLPGCFAQGETLDELTISAVDVIQTYLGLDEDGDAFSVEVVHDCRITHGTLGDEHCATHGQSWNSQHYSGGCPVWSGRNVAHVRQVSEPGPG